MITIVESEPKKISGRSSFFISFPFNQEIINIIKSSGLSVWHKKESLWEVPINSLSFLLDNLTYFDDIQLKLLEEDEADKDFIVSNSEEVWVSKLISKINSSL